MIQEGLKGKKRAEISEIVPKFHKSILEGRKERKFSNAVGFLYQNHCLKNSGRKIERKVGSFRIEFFFNKRSQESAEG